MQTKSVIVNLDIVRFDLNENPTVETKTICLNYDMSTLELSNKLYEILQISPGENKILKLRLEDGTLVTVSALLEAENNDRVFRLEVTRVHQNLPAQNRSQLHDVYLEAVRSKINSMDKRVTKVEALIPQVQLRREINNERTVNGLSSKVLFLERRIDELTPPQWKAQYA